MSKESPGIRISSQSLVIGLLLAAIGWLWTINERVAKLETQNDRITTLEDMMFPIAIEHEVSKQLRENAATEMPTSGPVAPTTAVPPNAPVVNNDHHTDAEKAAIEAIRKKATDKVKGRLPNVKMQGRLGSSPVRILPVNPPGG